MLISLTPQVFALEVLSYLNREYDGDDNGDGDDNVIVMMTRTMMTMMMMITINQKILKYILYKIIQYKDKESFVKQAFLIAFDLHCNGKNSFHSHLINMSKYFKLPYFNSDLLDITMVKSYVSLMKQEYISSWQNTLNLNFIDLLKVIIPSVVT